MSGQQTVQQPDLMELVMGLVTDQTVELVLCMLGGLLVSIMWTEVRKTFIKDQFRAREPSLTETGMFHTSEWISRRSRIRMEAIVVAAALMALTAILLVDNVREWESLALILLVLAPATGLMTTTAYDLWRERIEPWLHRVTK